MSAKALPSSTSIFSNLSMSRRLWRGMKLRVSPAALMIALLAGPAFGQEASGQDAGEQGAEQQNEAAPDLLPEQAAPATEDDADEPGAPTVEAGDQQEPVDPRILRRQEEERRERIERLSFGQPQIPKEGDVLATPNIPRGLLPKRGLRSGRIVYLPSANVGANFTDNANSDAENRQKDILVGVGANLRAQTVLRRHELGATASAAAGHSVEDVEEDFVDWAVGVDGRYDLNRQNAINASAETSLGREADSSQEAEDDDGAKLNLYGANLGYALNGRLLDFSINGQLAREDFSGDDTADRDNNSYTLSTRVTRQMGNRLSLFVAPSYTITEFDEDVSNDGEDRDSQEITGLVGADYRPRPRVRVGGSIGYSQAYFDDPDVDANGSVVGSLDASLAYDSRTDFTLGARREIQVTTVEGSASETETELSASVTRLLAPKHAVNTELRYQLTDFDGQNRADQDVTAGIDYFFRFSDHLIFNLGYQYLERFSDDDAAEFYENQVQLGVSVVY